MARQKQPPPTHATCPFRIVIDSNESIPFSFGQLKQFVRHSGKLLKLPLAVEVIRKPLWNFLTREVEIPSGKRTQSFTVGLADYSIEGLENEIQIERKSIPDLIGTLGRRRDRFEAEIKRLHEDCKFACVMIEGTPDDVIRHLSIPSQDVTVEGFGDDEFDIFAPSQQQVPPPHFATCEPLDDLFHSWEFDNQSDSTVLKNSSDFGNSPSLIDNHSLRMVANQPQNQMFNSEANGGITPAVVFGTMSSWMVTKYRNCPWIFAGSRSNAEALTFKFLSDYWNARTRELGSSTD